MQSKSSVIFEEIKWNGDLLSSFQLLNVSLVSKLKIFLVLKSLNKVSAAFMPFQFLPNAFKYTTWIVNYSSIADKENKNFEQSSKSQSEENFNESHFSKGVDGGKVLIKSRN